MIKAIKHKCTYPNCPYPCLDLPDCIDAEKQKVFQEPVAKVIDWGVEGPRLQGLTEDWPEVGTLLYTHPQPKREWVGLTEQEQYECMEARYEHGVREDDIPRIVEAKLKQKNGYAVENT